MHGGIAVKNEVVALLINFISFIPYVHNVMEVRISLTRRPSGIAQQTERHSNGVEVGGAIPSAGQVSLSVYCVFGYC